MLLTRFSKANLTPLIYKQNISCKKLFKDNNIFDNKLESINNKDILKNNKIIMKSEQQTKF